MNSITNGTDLMGLLKSIQMLGTRFEDWNFRWAMAEVRDYPVNGWLVRCAFERPDVNGEFDEQGAGYGRPWFIEYGASETGIVFTAWMAIQQIIIHELHESFTVMVNGERVRLLDPHKTLADLAVGSRRV